MQQGAFRGAFFVPDNFFVPDKWLARLSRDAAR
jgi:hypothetical protein